MVSRTLKIVAIDDNKDNLTVLQAVITDSLPESTLYTADTGLKGIDLIREQDPDVVLLDIVMPHMDGFEVCRAIKSRSEDSAHTGGFHHCTENRHQKQD